MEYREYEEYLDTVSGQIRNRKARAVAVKEIEAHMEDQADFYESRGMSRDEARREAVRQMGDPVEAGVELDRIHRPVMEWKLFGWIVVFSILGLAIQYICFGGMPGVSGQSRWIAGDSAGSFLRQCGYTAIGLAVMAGICLWDYSVIGKHASLLAACFLAGIIASCVFGVVRRINGGYPQLKCLLYLFVPLYGGILYRHRGQGYRGTGIGLWWIMALFFAGRVIGGGLGVTADAIAVCFVMLFSAVCGGWFYPSGKKSLTGAVILLGVLVVLGAVYARWWMSPYQLQRIRVWLQPENYARDGGYSIVTIRNIVSSLNLNGGCREALERRGLLPFLQEGAFWSDYVILQTAVTVGLLKTLCLLGLLAAFLFYLFRFVISEKNQLGKMMGFGCAMMLTVETVRNVLYNFGIGLGSTGGLPFLSYGKVHTLAIYVLLGFLLSICRYRNLVWDEPVKKERGAETRIGRYVIRVEKAPLAR